jgi:hypothetical protein
MLCPDRCAAQADQDLCLSEAEIDTGPCFNAHIVYESMDTDTIAPGSNWGVNEDYPIAAALP